MSDEVVSRRERVRQAIELLRGSADTGMTTDEMMELLRGEELPLIPAPIAADESEIQDKGCPDRL